MLEVNLTKNAKLGMGVTVNMYTYLKSYSQRSLLFHTFKSIIRKKKVKVSSPIVVYA